MGAWQRRWWPISCHGFTPDWLEDGLNAYVFPLAALLAIGDNWLWLYCTWGLFTRSSLST